NRHHDRAEVEHRVCSALALGDRDAQRNSGEDREAHRDADNGDVLDRALADGGQVVQNERQSLHGPPSNGLPHRAAILAASIVGAPGGKCYRYDPGWSIADFGWGAAAGGPAGVAPATIGVASRLVANRLKVR